MKLNIVIQEYKNGDTSAAKRLYHYSNRYLFAIALRYVESDDLAKDVLQDAYIKIFKKLYEFKYIDEASTMAWMKQICIYEAFSVLRKKKNWDKLQSTSVSLVVNNNHALYNEELYQVLNKLPERQRLVFTLFGIEGYSHKEIGSILQIKEGNSRALLSRARNFLSEHISKEMIHETA